MLIIFVLFSTVIITGKMIFENKEEQIANKVKI